MAKTAKDIKKVRISFIDLSDQAGIGVREIDLWGKSTNFFKLPAESLNHGTENFRWGAALQYDRKTDSFLVGLWGQGIYRFSRSGEVLAKYNYPNITHSIEILENGNLMFPFSWSSRDQKKITEIDPSGKVVWSWSAAKFIDDEDPSMSSAKREPETFVAITGAIALDDQTIVATLSQANSVVFIDRASGGG